MDFYDTLFFEGQNPSASLQSFRTPLTMCLENSLETITSQMLGTISSIRECTFYQCTNLKRITGVNKNVYEVNLKEIRKLDAGKFKGKEFAGEKIPLLEEVLDWAQDNNMKLNIEIKPTGYEKNIEEKKNA